VEAADAAEPSVNTGGGVPCEPRQTADYETDAAWLARGSALVFAGSFVAQGFQFGGQILLARMLGPASFGLYGIGLTLLRLVAPLAAIGLPSGVIYAASLAGRSDNGRKRDLLLQSLGLGLLVGGAVGAIGYVAAPGLAAKIFGKGRLTAVIRAFSLAMPILTVLMVATASTKLSMSMVYSVCTDMFVQPGLNLLFLAVAVYFLQWRLIGAVAATVLSYALSLLLALYFMFSLFWPLLRSREKMRSYVGELLAFSVPASIAGALTNFINRVDRLVVGAFLPAAEVGIYQAASQTSALFDIMPNIFNSVIAVRVADLYARSDIKRLDELFKVGARWSFYLSVPLFLVVCSAPAGLMELFYGVHYRPGAWPLLIICMGMMSDVIIGAASQILIFSGHQKLASSISVAALAGAIALNYMLVPRFGMIGGALSTALAEASMLVGFLLGVKSYLGVWPYDRRSLKGIAAILCAAIGLGLVRIWMGAAAELAVITNLIVAEGLFWATLLLFGLDPEDKNLLWANPKADSGSDATKQTTRERSRCA
jgi:O-antigen/teichoic acid export membrane protein